MKFYRDIKTNSVFAAFNDENFNIGGIIELKANTVDASFEKHVPVYEKNGDEIIVRIGSIVHPMTEEHYIMFIALVSNKEINIVRLNPGDEAIAKFKYSKGSKIYAYCNLHSLWENTVE